MSTMSTNAIYNATLATPEPRNGLDGLMHFIRITFAKLGLIINEFHTPNYQQLESFRLVHLKFDFILETEDRDEHRREFRLSSDTLEFRTRSSYATRILERLHEYAAAETAYLALDKETRGPMTAKPLEVVHTQASERGTEKLATLSPLLNEIVDAQENYDEYMKTYTAIEEFNKTVKDDNYKDAEKYYREAGGYMEIIHFI